MQVSVARQSCSRVASVDIFLDIWFCSSSLPRESSTTTTATTYYYYCLVVVMMTDLVLLYVVRFTNELNSIIIIALSVLVQFIGRGF